MLEQQGVSPEIRFSKDNCQTIYFKIFWMSWNWPSYSREYKLYWVRWHLVVKTTSLSVNNPYSTLQFYRSWMWRHLGTRHRSCLSEPTNSTNSAGSCSKIQNTMITGHSSQHRMNCPLTIMWWKFRGQSDNGPCGYHRGIQSHCVMLSPSTMTYSVICMGICKWWLERTLNGRKTCSSPWS